MGIIPKVNEYWYARVNSSVKIGKLIIIYEDSVFYKTFTEYYTVFMNKDEKDKNKPYLLGRWEPNWFWRILGYK